MVAFRPGSHISDITSTPSVDVSDWDDMNTHHSGSNVLKELDSPIDLTEHILSPFYIRDLNYQDSRFHSMAHLMCYGHAVVAGQKTFATGIRKWSPHPNSRQLTGSGSGYLQSPVSDGCVI